MLKERYEKPVMRPAEQDNGLMKEEYQTPDMEVVSVRTTLVTLVSDATTNTKTIVIAAETTEAPKPIPTSTPDDPEDDLARTLVPPVNSIRL